MVSIVGRFLEHARIYYFRNGGAEEYFIGSADCMKRNLESRVECSCPVEDPPLRKRAARRARHAAQAQSRGVGHAAPTAATCGCPESRRIIASSR